MASCSGSEGTRNCHQRTSDPEYHIVSEGSRKVRSLEVRGWDRST